HPDPPRALRAGGDAGARPARPQDRRGRQARARCTPCRAGRPRAVDGAGRRRGDLRLRRPPWPGAVRRGRNPGRDKSSAPLREARGPVVRRLLVVALVVAPAAEAKPLQAKIQRTKYGVPHITAKNIKSLAAGWAYAFAQDNLCTIAEEYVTVNAERSRFFG